MYSGDALFGKLLFRRSAMAVPSATLYLLFTCFVYCNAISCSVNQEIWTLVCTDVASYEGYGISTLTANIQRCTPGQKLVPGQCSDPLSMIVNATLVVPATSVPPFSQKVPLTGEVQIPLFSPFIYLTLKNLNVSPTSVSVTIGATLCAISCSIASKTFDVHTLTVGDPDIDPCTLPADVQCPADGCTFGSSKLEKHAVVPVGTFAGVVVVLSIVCVGLIVGIIFLFVKLNAAGGSLFG